MDVFFRMSIAEKNIEVMCHHQTVFKQCKAYLSNFNTPDLQITITPEELETAVADLPPIMEHYDGVATTRFYGDAESRVVHEKIALEMLSFDTFLLHGAVVAYENYAYVFIAPSGVGKTTRIKLWLDVYPESFIVNGDKPLIKIKDYEAVACGTPWCGKEGYNTNAIVPIRAIFLLERADNGEESLIKQLSVGQAFPALLQQVYKPKNLERLLKTIQLIKKLDGKVLFYKFRSTPTTEAIRLAYETARPR